MWKKYIYDPGIWFLCVLNIYIVFDYLNHPGSIHTIIVIYWLQSIFIGIFNGANILTLTHTVPNSFTINGTDGNRTGCAGLFFLLHYGFFHIMYVFFLVPGIVDLRLLDWSFLKITFWLIIFCSIIEFIQDKKRNRTEEVNIGMMFFMPYLRIVPMHLLILTPALLSFSKPIVFLLLKCVTDVVLYVVYKQVVYKPVKEII